MTDAVLLIVQYRSWIYLCIAAAGLLYLRSLMRARRYLGRTPFGLEREVALARQNSAVAMLLVLSALGASVYLLDRVVLPELTQAAATQAVVATPTPTTSPVVFSETGVVVVDSSGCDNPQATLTAPKPGERITGAFEVRGTADIENFAFYKFDINGLGTGGAWVPVGVGNAPVVVVDGELGRFDAGAYASGEYAFRLTVLDSAGQFPLPCVVPITLVSPAP